MVYFHFKKNGNPHVYHQIKGGRVNAAFWWAGCKNRPAGNLGCGEPEKNPLPGLEIGMAQGICAAGHVVMEG